MDVTDVALPALLRAARRTYGRAIRGDLDRAGYDDVPANGVFVLGAVARTGAPLAEIIAELGMSKQAAGALVDTLVTRGYLDRSPDPDDRRRLIVTLTPRGEAAAEHIRGAVDAIDAQLLERAPAAHLRHTRQTLLALIELGRTDA